MLWVICDQCLIVSKIFHDILMQTDMADKNIRLAVLHQARKSLDQGKLSNTEKDELLKTSRYPGPLSYNAFPSTGMGE